MLEKAILESTIFYNFSRIFQQFTTASSVDLSDNNTISNAEGRVEAKKNMTTALKLKAIFNAVFFAPNPMLIQKSMRHVDASFDSTHNDTNEYRLKREKNNESVRKSRAKNRVKLQECSSSVKDLKLENIQLNDKLNRLQSELYTLKGLFQHCFTFDLNNLSIKPSDIPTSTLYKIIMQNKTQTTTLPNQTAPTQSSKLVMNDVDNYYVDQIKNALTDISKPDVYVNSIEKWIFQ